MTRCPLIPLADRVVLVPDAAPTHSGLIVLPNATAPAQGTVVAVGPGRVWPSGAVDPCESAVGDHVVYAKYVGTDVEIDGRHWLLVRDADVLARLG